MNLFFLGAVQHALAVFVARAVQRDSLMLQACAVFASVTVWWYLIREIVIATGGADAHVAYMRFVAGCVVGSLIGKGASRALERGAGSEVK